MRNVEAQGEGGREITYADATEEPDAALHVICLVRAGRDGPVEGWEAGAFGEATVRTDKPAGESKPT